MTTTTLEQEEKAFTALCDQLIAGSPESKEVENAVIELEVGHKKCLNAARREFNAEVDKNEAAVKAIRDDYDKNRELDKEAFHKQVEEVRKDYQGQIDRLRQKQTEEIARIKDTYATLDHERKRSDSMVGRIADDHARELQRVNDEWARKMSIKETEILAIQQQMEDTARVADQQLHEEAQRTDALVEETSTMQEQIKDLEDQKVSLHEVSKEQLDELIRQQDRLLKGGHALVNNLQDNADSLEMALSRLRVSLLNQDYTKVRDAVRAKEASDQKDEMLKQVDDLQTRKESERQELAELLDRVKTVSEGQKSAIAAFEAQVTDEATQLDKLRAQKVDELARASQARRSRANSMSISQTSATAYPRRVSARSRHGSTITGPSFVFGDSPRARVDSQRSGRRYTDPSTE